MEQGAPQEQAADSADSSRLQVVGPHLSTGVFHHAAVGHARRANGLAGAALEAGLPVGHDLGGYLDAALVHRLHQGDAPAGRLHLHPGLHVGRAGTQAQAAVHTPVHVGFRRGVGTLEPCQQGQRRERGFC